MVIIIIPYNHIGGAEKVHLEIIRAISPQMPLFIVFTNAGGGKISEDFRKYLYINLKGSKLIALFCAISIVMMSRLTKLTLFGSNNRFFYNLLPFIGKGTRTIDLTHAFTGSESGIEVYSKKYVSFLSERIVINKRTLEDYRNQYQKEWFDLSLMDRIRIIPNGIDIRPFEKEKVEGRFNHFTIGYLGRFSPEKRPDIFLELAKATSSVNCQAKMICDCFNAKEAEYPMVDKIIGINDPERIRRELSTISVLLITSDREGFPVSIMEAMEQGIPVISSNVGSISEHIISGHNGFLAEPNMSDESFIDFCRSKIEDIRSNRSLYFKLSNNARLHAQNNFALSSMHKAYKDLICKSELSLHTHG